MSANNSFTEIPREEYTGSERYTKKTKEPAYVDQPSDLQSLSTRSTDSMFHREIISHICVGKYRSSIGGEQLIKDVVSLHLYSVLIQREKPKTIFDLGTCGDGSALWSARECRAENMTSTKIVTLDIEDFRSESCKQEMKKEGIMFVLADLRKGLKVIAENGIDLPHPWLISEDCHVGSHIILKSFLDLGMRSGDNILFEDKHEDTPNDVNMSALNMKGYQCGEFARKKYALMMSALMAYGGDDSFAVDATIQDMYGYNGACFLNSVIRMLWVDMIIKNYVKQMDEHTSGTFLA